jgi:hypothetical protein
VAGREERRQGRFLGSRSDLISPPGALRSSVVGENCPYSPRLGAWLLLVVSVSTRRDPYRVFRSTPGLTMLPVSPLISLGWRAQSRPREPWNVAFEHECQIPVSPALPGTGTRTREDGVVGDGCGTPAVRGDRLFEEGREGMCAHPRSRPTGELGDGDHVGRDDRTDPRSA